MKKKWLGDFVVMLLIWVGLIVLFGMLSEHFLSARTLGSLANRIPSLTVIAVGMTFVLIIGGIDLSVGSVMGLCGALVGLAMVDWEWGLFPALLLSMAVGLIAGAVNGGVSVYLKIPSFIVTLGMLEIARGLAYMTTDSQTKYIGSSVESISQPMGGIGVSLAFVLAILLVAAGQILLNRMVLGRKSIAIGTNESAASLAGIETRFPRVLVFALIGALTGLAAVFYTSRLGSADPNAGVGMELSAIAAVVIGGTSLMGGRGSVVNSFFGVLIIATLEAGLAQVGASEPLKRVVTGSVIVVAVIIDAWKHRVGGSPLDWLKTLFGKDAEK